MPHPPYRDALVPLDHRLGQPVQVGVRAALVELHQVDPTLGNQRVEGFTEPLAGPLHRAPPGRFETGAVTQHGADRLKGPRTQMPQHLQLSGDELDPQRGAGQQPGGGVDGPRAHLADGFLDLEAGELEPQLSGLMHRLEQQLVAVDHLVGPALQ